MLTTIRGWRCKICPEVRNNDVLCCWYADYQVNVESIERSLACEMLQKAGKSEYEVMGEYITRRLNQPEPLSLLQIHPLKDLRIRPATRLTSTSSIYLIAGDVI
jgi:hypothetical protein